MSRTLLLLAGFALAACATTPAPRYLCLPARTPDGTEVMLCAPLQPAPATQARP